MSSLARALEIDLDWREAELAILREHLSRKEMPATTGRVFFRGACALLYAHYEGFSKYSLDLYLDSLSKLLSDCNGLPDGLFVYTIDNEIRKSKSFSSRDTYKFFITDVTALRSQKPQFATVDTKSNLWPDLLLRTTDDLDLEKSDLVVDERKIQTLVARRNDIAHGKKVFVQDLPYYLEYERAALNLMYSLALAIVGRFEKFEAATTRP